LEDVWFTRALGAPADNKPGKGRRELVEQTWRARGIDIDRLLELLPLSADERLRRLESFSADMGRLRSDLTRSSRR
jgi:hypothetical protein